MTDEEHKEMHRTADEAAANRGRVCLTCGKPERLVRGHWWCSTCEGAFYPPVDDGR